MTIGENNISAPKMAAISAAILTYIKTGEEAAYYAAQAEADAQGSAMPSPASAGPPNMWGTAGRSDIMQMRSMMQMRAFK